MRIARDQRQHLPISALVSPVWCSVVVEPGHVKWLSMLYEGKGCRTFKDPQPSFNSPIAKLVQDYPIKSCSVVADLARLIGARWRWKILTRLPASYGGVTGLWPGTERQLTATNSWKPATPARSVKPSSKKLLCSLLSEQQPAHRATWRQCLNIWPHWRMNCGEGRFSTCLLRTVAM